jgi:diadenosine tetraphosphatase ApaH/serine/threonine PP2A family protein phosphatase
MRLALLADIHANEEAFAACLAHASAVGVDGYALLGDLVGYGADPCSVIDRAIELVRGGAPAVLGNHDAAVVAGAGPRMSPDARRVVEWTRSRLDEARIAFLARLPEKIEQDDRLLVHANAWNPLGWEYIGGRLEAGRSMRATSRRLTFCGHIHEPILFHMGQDGRVHDFVPTPGREVPLARPRRWLVIPGSVGQPRDGDPSAAYAIFDDEREVLTTYRVPYDHEVTASKIEALGLPANLGARLRRGH